jgi:hypothetical protein
MQRLEGFTFDLTLTLAGNNGIENFCLFFGNLNPPKGTLKLLSWIQKDSQTK